MVNLESIIKQLKEYDGPTVKLMEVCGTHTASIFKNGIRSLISDKIKLISGPGCPVCVTPAAFIDKAIELAQKDNHILLSFGDMLKVPGKRLSLSEAKTEGAKVEIMYSPIEILEKAKSNPEITYVIAAVGFETTAPVYGILLKNAEQQNIKNIKLLTALKTVIPALDWLCTGETDIDGFICPGHVSTIIGSEVYGPLAEKYRKPFVVAGFEAEHILVAIFDLLVQIQKKQSKVVNLYTNAVEKEGNKAAQALIDKYFIIGTSNWRGLGTLADSGLYLKDEYLNYDAGSFGLFDTEQKKDGCSCDLVITGRIDPNECALFGNACTPISAQGPCMVSSEGSCGIWYRNTLR